MKKFDKLSAFSSEHSNTEKYSLASVINSIAKHLEANVTLIDNDGRIVHSQKHCASNQSQENDTSHQTGSLYTDPLYNLVPVWSRGRSLGALVIHKPELSPEEHTILEQAAAIISLRKQLSF